MTIPEELKVVYNEYVGVAEMWNANSADDRVNKSKTFYTISHKLLGYLFTSMEAYDKQTKEAWGPSPLDENVQDKASFE